MKAKQMQQCPLIKKIMIHVVYIMKITFFLTLSAILSAQIFFKIERDREDEIYFEIWHSISYIHCLINVFQILGSGRSGSIMSGVRNYFRLVSEHKEIVRSVMALQGIMYMYKPDIEKLIKVTITIIC